MTNEGFVSKETVVQGHWGSETFIFGNKQVYKGEICTSLHG